MKHNERLWLPQPITTKIVSVCHRPGQSFQRLFQRARKWAVKYEVRELWQLPWMHKLVLSVTHSGNNCWYSDSYVLLKGDQAVILRPWYPSSCGDDKIVNIHMQRLPILIEGWQTRGWVRQLGCLALMRVCWLTTFQYCRRVWLNSIWLGCCWFWFVFCLFNLSFPGNKHGCLWCTFNDLLLMFLLLHFFPPNICVAKQKVLVQTKT